MNPDNSRPLPSAVPLAIEKIIYPGKSLGRSGGKTVLTDEGLPGETVEIEVLKEKSNFTEARTIRVQAPSAFRRSPRCAHYKACAPYQIMDDSLQIEVKTGQLRELLTGMGGPGGSEIEVLPSPVLWNYRNKARFHVLWTSRGGRPAYYVPETRDRFIPVEVCHLIPPPIQSVIADALAAFKRPVSALREIEAKISGATGDILLNLHWKETPAGPDLDLVLTRLLEGHQMAGIVGIVAHGGKVEEILHWGRDFIIDRVAGTEYQIGARSFFQINPHIFPFVLDEMRSALRDSRAATLADLYCGLGTFGLALSPLLKKVYFVESEPENIAFLKKNIRLNPSDALTICDGPAEEWMPWILDRGIDAAVLDPPRKGLDPSLIKRLNARPVPLVLYLSCNPSTLARDLKLFGRSYQVAGIKGFDFFPHTPHIETLVVLKAKA